ncbi:MAG: hypothetical protein AAGK22_10165 [Acidobacteriota bacterium]
MQAPQSPIRQCSSFKRRLVAVLLFATLLTLPLSATTGPWLDVDEAQIPFDEEAQILDFLTTAEIVGSKTLSQGINKSLKLTLQKDGVTAHAVFRTVSVEHKQGASRSHPSRNTFRDSYIFEKAAYELSQLLELNRVPPTVLRTIDGQEGTVQLWIEGAKTDAALIQSPGPESGNAGLRHLQKQVMLVFDNLVYNFDRHQNNMLFDRDQRLWFIDHTRSFRGRPELPKRQKIAVIDADLLEKLRSVDEKEIRKTLSPYLNRIETDAVVKRKRLLVRRFEQLLAERGEQGVLYDLGQVTRESREISRRRLAADASQEERKLLDWTSVTRPSIQLDID